ncbi:MAG TPA: hypothetical protein VNY07_06125 [Chthoniobacterales bacterium]|nr:hypothetical protein [Chthoniobacterales bacterium]
MALDTVTFSGGIMNKWIIAIVVLVGVAIAGIVARWCRSRSRKDEAVNLIPGMLEGSTPPTQQDVAKILTKNCDEYKSNGSRWGSAYFGSVFGSAVCSALAALILKLHFLKGDPDLRPDLAAISATLAALLVTLSTVVDFRRKWQACRVAEVDVQNLAYDLLSQDATRADTKAILEHLTKINTAYNQAIVGTDQARPRDLKPKTTTEPPHE